MFLRLDLIAAIVPLVRAVFREAKTTEARTPMIAITTSNSIRVKPLIKLLFHPPPARGAI